MLLLAALLGLGPTAANAARGPWRITVVGSQSATVAVPAASKSQRGRIVRPLEVDASDLLATHSVIRVRVRNVTSAPQLLRWDVARTPIITLEGGSTMAPIGHKLPGLAANSIATAGVIEVRVPPNGAYTLYPVYDLDPATARGVIAIDRVGRTRLTR